MITYREIDRLLYLRANYGHDDSIWKNKKVYLKKELKRFFPYEVEVASLNQSRTLHFIEEAFGHRLLGHDGPPYHPEAKWDWFENPLFRIEEDAVMFKLGFIPLPR
jgi:hypothetical protein